MIDAGRTPTPMRDGLRRFTGLAAELAGPTRAVTKAAIVLEGATKEELSHPGSGRFYKSRGVRSALKRGAGDRIRGVQGPLRKGAQAQLHQASAPGEPPAPDIGELRRTVGRETVGNVVRVGSPLPQSSALEFGHIYPDGHVLLARPFMRPSYERVKGEMTGVVLKELRIGTRGIGGGAV